MAFLLLHSLFDENFKYVPAGSGFLTLGEFSDDLQVLAQQDIPVNTNGYLFVYLSNETEHYDVFFDDLSVVLTPGPLLEETHYYPFGLVMAGISSKAAGGVQNKLKYNGKELQSGEFSDGGGLDWSDYGARMMDVQLGRWFSVDPLAEEMRRHSVYNYAFDNPIMFIDPDGMKTEIRVNKKGQKIYDPMIINFEKGIAGLKKIQVKIDTLYFVGDAGLQVTARRFN